MLYKHKTLKDKTHPIMLQLVHMEKAKRYTIAKSCKTEQWNNSKGMYNSKMPNYQALNVSINKIRNKTDKILTTIENSGKPFTFDTFDRHYKGVEKPSSLYNFIETLITEMEHTGRIGNRNIYKSTLSALKKFKPSMNTQLEDVDYKFLVGFQNFMFSIGSGKGGLSVHMRTLRAIINEAIKRGFLDKELYPFSTNQSNGYKVSELKSDYNPRSLSEIDMDKIKHFDSDLNTHLRKPHLYFLFSYYSGGMSFVDMAHLRWSDIVGNRINYKRKKVHTAFSININEHMKEILDYFKMENQKPDQYIFPILDSKIHKNPLLQNLQVRNISRDYNRRLKVIQKMLGIEQNLTSYVARHTYAQTLKRKGHSLEVIQAKLGHSDLSTTKAYINKIAVNELDYVDNDL